MSDATWPRVVPDGTMKMTSRGEPAFVLGYAASDGNYFYMWRHNPNYIPHTKPLIHNGRKPR